jgi:hypothetical protein
MKWKNDITEAYLGQHAARWAIDKEVIKSEAVRTPNQEPERRIRSVLRNCSISGRERSIGLLELESHSDKQFRPDEGGFAMRSLPSKFF